MNYCGNFNEFKIGHYYIYLKEDSNSLRYNIPFHIGLKSYKNDRYLYECNYLDGKVIHIPLQEKDKNNFIAILSPRFKYSLKKDDIYYNTLNKKFIKVEAEEIDIEANHVIYVLKYYYRGAKYNIGDEVFYKGTIKSINNRTGTIKCVPLNKSPFGDYRYTVSFLSPEGGVLTFDNISEYNIKSYIKSYDELSDEDAYMLLTRKSLKRKFSVPRKKNIKILSQ